MSLDGSLRASVLRASWGPALSPGLVPTFPGREGLSPHFSGCD